MIHSIKFQKAVLRQIKNSYLIVKEWQERPL